MCGKGCDIMIVLKNIREDLENHKNAEIIFNLSNKGCKRFEQEYTTVEELLKYPDSYEIPYMCYEVIYDWDDFGSGDGRDAICFYSQKPSFLETNKKAAYAYSAKIKEM